MLCCNCDEYNFILSIEEYVVREHPKENIINFLFDEYSQKCFQDITCESCGTNLVSGESYFPNKMDVINELKNYVISKMNQMIIRCEECSEIKDFCYSFEQNFEDDESIDTEIDPAKTLAELLNEQFNIDYESEYFDSIVENIHCGNCGNGTGVDYENKKDNGVFNWDTEVYTNYELDEFEEKFYGEKEELRTDISLMALNFSKEELNDLKNDYIKNKIYISRNPHFRKLENRIKKWFKDGEFIYKMNKNRILYRTRVVDIDKIVDKKDLWAPPATFANQGRFNDIGTSVLYCSNDKSILEKEVPIKEDDTDKKKRILVKIISNRILNLFPINYIFGKDEGFNGLISEKDNDFSETVIKKHYIICNIVSAICSKIGYDGIVYKSVKSGEYINYAIFNVKEDEDLGIIDKLEITYNGF
ncbi:RES domain-containing protein [Streptococcus oralis]|jgi:hypothetical protein|uniref:RES domain-containing protein n=1 Tax=Streptococcus oralis TaxID=1303 RepID=A0A7T2ZYF6_STROR|nr:RES domain-containing protein [Streptococcus oralis]QPT01464.1 RES domain-containing protein [Streptococcus oralis]CAK1608960.1 RES domain-containing protein [Streptococcus oralis subsp. dentisani]